MSYMLNAKIICDPTMELECRQIDTGNIRIKGVDHIVIHGRVTECNGVGIEGAVVKVFRRRDNGKLVGIDHTFSGCDGNYLINVPDEEANRPIVVMASASTCHKPGQCNNEDCNLSCPAASIDEEITE